MSIAWRSCYPSEVDRYCYGNLHRCSRCGQFRHKCTCGVVDYGCGDCGRSRYGDWYNGYNGWDPYDRCRPIIEYEVPVIINNYINCREHKRDCCHDRCKRKRRVSFSD